MSIDTVLGCLGEPVGDPRTASVLRSIGVADPHALQLPAGEYSTYVVEKAGGYSLIFTDEAMFLGKAAPIGTGPLYFAGVFLYAGGKDGYSAYAGELPLGMTFQASREQVVDLLGEPSWHREAPAGGPGADRWDDQAPYRVHVTYDPDGRPSVISCHKPNAT